MFRQGEVHLDQRSSVWLQGLRWAPRPQAPEHQRLVLDCWAQETCPYHRPQPERLGILRRVSFVFTIFLPGNWYQTQKLKLLHFVQNQQAPAWQPRTHPGWSSWELPGYPQQLLQGWSPLARRCLPPQEALGVRRERVSDQLRSLHKSQHWCLIIWSNGQIHCQSWICLSSDI